MTINFIQCQNLNRAQVHSCMKYQVTQTRFHQCGCDQAFVHLHRSTTVESGMNDKIKTLSLGQDYSWHCLWGVPSFKTSVRMQECAGDDFHQHHQNNRLEAHGFPLFVKISGRRQRLEMTIDVHFNAKIQYIQCSRNISGCSYLHYLKQ